MNEYTGGDLREKIVEIICGWWGEEKTEHGDMLDSATIREQLARNLDAEVSDQAIIAVLSELADRGHVKLSFVAGTTDDEGRNHGGMSIHSVVSDLCL